MSDNIKRAVELLEMLPESEQEFAIELLRKLVVAWDPDYTKLTPAERAELEEAERDAIENGSIPFEDIDWDLDETSESQDNLHT